MKNHSNLTEDDFIRRNTPATEISYRDGILHLSARGVIELCNAIIEGRAAGDRAAAFNLRANIQAKHGKD